MVLLLVVVIICKQMLLLKGEFSYIVLTAIKLYFYIHGNLTHIFLNLFMCTLFFFLTLFFSLFYKTKKQNKKTKQKNNKTKQNTIESTVSTSWSMLFLFEPLPCKHRNANPTTLSRASVELPQTTQSYATVPSVSHRAKS